MQCCSRSDINRARRASSTLQHQLHELGSV
jgi:hypothetical protein